MYTFVPTQSSQLTVLVIYLNPTHGEEREKKFKIQTY